MISLLLGLGNIGKKYQQTRHNLGFELLDRVAVKLGVEKRNRTDLFDWAEVVLPAKEQGNARPSEGETRGEALEGEKGERRLVLAWPRTYMNCSGDAAIKLLGDNGITVGEMLVLVDDFALPLGTIRFRGRGSDGGHNGLASLVEVLGSQEFPRLRMGIGPVDKSTDIVDFVLSKFGAEERKQVDTMLDRATEAVLFVIEHRFDEAMSKYNNSPALPESA